MALWRAGNLCCDTPFMATSDLYLRDRKRLGVGVSGTEVLEDDERIGVALVLDPHAGLRRVAA